MTTTLKIGLAAWVIQDGNYGDFQRGRRYAFALEFWARNGLRPRHPDAAPRRSLTWLHDCTYAVEAEASFVGEGWWVIDAVVKLYSDQPSPSDIVPGRQVHGEINVSIDPLFYLESLSLLPEAPPLIYDWRIEAIELDTRPRIGTRSNFWERDNKHPSWRRLPKTNAWKDEGGAAEYVLTCSRLSDEGRLKR